MWQVPHTHTDYLMLELVDSILQRFVGFTCTVYCSCTYQSSNIQSGLHPVVCWMGRHDGVIFSQGTDSPAEEHSASGFVYI